jgi:Asp-tRNA(Asn)/Glu-tRNA(Gln) amidotransferase A subunit family amidase
MGSDDCDPTVTDLPFNWNADADLSRLRVGYLAGAFEEDKRNHNARALKEIRGLGLEPDPVELPDLPFNDMGFILTVEAAAAFDEFTRSDLDDELASQQLTAWPSTFRRARMVPAVEYIRANRVRTLLMEAMREVFENLDVIVMPSVSNLYLGNFTGHPMIAVPNGFNAKSGVPTSIGFMGRLYGEADIMALARSYQESTGYHRKHPDLSAL